MSIESDIQWNGGGDVEVERWSEIERTCDTLIDRRVGASLGQRNSTDSRGDVVDEVIIDLLESRIELDGNRILIDVKLS